jgi:hypothetical protein
MIDTSRIVPKNEKKLAKIKGKRLVIKKGSRYRKSLEQYKVLMARYNK